MASEVGRIEVRDGTELLTRRWLAPAEKKALVVLVHGLAEHSGRYDHVGTALADRGLETVSYDYRGHGQSGGHPMYVEEWTHFIDDLEDVIAWGRYEHLPLVAYGHSTGGLMVFDYITHDRPPPDLAVLSAPALDANAKAWQRLLAPIVGRLVPKLALPAAITGEQLSRDPAVGEAYFADEFVATKTTARLGAEFFAAQDRVRGREPTIPTLVVHGGQDELIPPSASADLEDHEAVTRELYPELRHELHNEPESDEVIAYIADWVEANLAAL